MIEGMQQISSESVTHPWRQGPGHLKEKRLINNGLVWFDFFIIMGTFMFTDITAFAHRKAFLALTLLIFAY